MLVKHNRNNIIWGMMIVLSKISCFIDKATQYLLRHRNSSFRSNIDKKVARDPHAISVDQDLSVSPYRFPDIDYNISQSISIVKPISRDDSVSQQRVPSISNTAILRPGGISSGLFLSVLFTLNLHKDQRTPSAISLCSTFFRISAHVVAETLDRLVSFLILS